MFWPMIAETTVKTRVSQTALGKAGSAERLAEVVEADELGSPHRCR